MIPEILAGILRDEWIARQEEPNAYPEWSDLPSRDQQGWIKIAQWVIDRLGDHYVELTYVGE